jgi:hypothetical protein
LVAFRDADRALVVSPRNLPVFLMPNSSRLSTVMLGI